MGGGIKYNLWDVLDTDGKAAMKTMYNAKLNTTTCRADADCMAEIKKFLGLDENDRTYAMELQMNYKELKNQNATALMKQAVTLAKGGDSAYDALLVDATIVEKHLKCDWTGPWGKMDWANGIADYKPDPGRGVSAVCAVHRGEMTLAGCVFRKNCTALNLRAHMIDSTEKPCPRPMKHKDTCEVACEKGYVLQTKKIRKRQEDQELPDYAVVQ
jgi:hypothetical protein